MHFSIATFAALALVVGLSSAYAEGVPALKVTTSNGHSSIVIGTMHVPYKGLRQPVPNLLDGRRRLVIESSRRQGPQPKEVSSLDLLAPNARESLRTGHGLARAPWASDLTENNVTQLLERARCAVPGMTSDGIEMILAFKTAEMAAALAYRRCESLGSLSRDEILNKAAHDRNIPIDVLETQVEVDQRRKAVPAQYYEDSLKEAFSPEIESRYLRVVDGLNRGDYATVLDVSLGPLRHAEDAVTFKRLMIDERNHAWMGNLSRYLNEGNAVVAVGAAHLPGPQGLTALLKKAGYKVESIVVPAGDTP